VDIPPIKFRLGRLVIMPGALEALRSSDESPGAFLVRHVAGDWGDLEEEDKRLNEQALKDGSRIFSAYHTAKGLKLYVITEADRLATTILLPGEY
jgi:hypothetical protein